MRRITMKATSLWNNIDHIAVISFKKDGSVYQCAHFYDHSSVFLPNLSRFRRS